MNGDRRCFVPSVYERRAYSKNGEDGILMYILIII
jgi:hypothetical protein